MIVEELSAAFGLDIDAAAFARAEEMLRKLATGLTGMGLVALGVLGGLAEVTRETAKAGDEADVTADKLGITTKAFQELSFAADLSDSSVEALTTGLGHFSLMLTQAKEGSKEARDLIGRFAGSMYDASGNMKAPDELLGDIADKFKAMPKGVERTGYAMRLFGRGGRELIPMLIQGKAGIAALRAEAETLGIVLDQKTIEASTKWDEANKRLSWSLVGLRNKVGGPLIGYLTEIEIAMAGWIKRNGDLIASRIVSFVDGLARALRFLTSDTDGARLAWFSFWTVLLANSGAIQKLIAGMTWLGNASAASAWKSALAWAKATLPLLALAALIVIITDDLYVFIQGGDSMLGRLIRWADIANPTDGPGIAWLKASISLLEDLTDEKKWDKFGAAIDRLLVGDGPMGRLWRMANAILDTIEAWGLAMAGRVGAAKDLLSQRGTLDVLSSGGKAAIKDQAEGDLIQSLAAAAKQLNQTNQPQYIDARSDVNKTRSRIGLPDLSADEVLEHRAGKNARRAPGAITGNPGASVTITNGDVNFSFPPGMSPEQMKQMIIEYQQERTEADIAAAKAAFTGSSVSTSANDGAGGPRPGSTSNAASGPLPGLGG